VSYDVADRADGRAYDAAHPNATGTKASWAARLDRTVCILTLVVALGSCQVNMQAMRAAQDSARTAQTMVEEIKRHNGVLERAQRCSVSSGGVVEAAREERSLP